MFAKWRHNIFFYQREPSWGRNLGRSKCSGCRTGTIDKLEWQSFGDFLIENLVLWDKVLMYHASCPQAQSWSPTCTSCMLGLWYFVNRPGLGLSICNAGGPKWCCYLSSTMWLYSISPALDFPLGLNSNSIFRHTRTDRQCIHSPFSEPMCSAV